MIAEINEKDALVLVQQRNEFYKKKYHQVLGLIILCFVMIGILLAVFLFLLRNVTQPFYFIASDVGIFMPEVSNTQPFAAADVSAWAAEAIEAVNTYDYVNYHAQLQDAQKYFTDFSWTQFMKALTDSSNLVAVRDRKWISVGKVVSPPKLINSGIINGYYAWKFQVPVLVTFLQPPTYDNNSALHNAWQYEIIVIRQSLLQSYKGLAIYSAIGSVAAPTSGTPAVMPAS